MILVMFMVVAFAAVAALIAGRYLGGAVSAGGGASGHPRANRTSTTRAGRFLIPPMAKAWHTAAMRSVPYARKAADRQPELGGRASGQKR